MTRLTGDDLARMSMAERHEALRTLLSRRGLLRAAGAGAAALGSGPVLLAPAAGAATSGAVPLLARWLAFGEDPRTEVRVRWQVGGPVTGAKVRYGTNEGYGADVPADLEELRTLLPDGRVVRQWYAGASLGGLQPGTTYHYQVVHDGGVASQDASFRTAPEPADRTPFRFTAFGDQSVTSWARSIEQVLGRFDPAFHLLAGDISYADMSGQGIATDDYDASRWDEYFQQIDPVASKVPWMVAAGNHDMEALFDQHGYGGLLKRFAFPAGGPSGCPTAYSFTYGRVGFLMADSNDLSYELQAVRSFSQGRQLAWAEDRLAALRQSPDVDFVVVVLHHCAFATSQAHASDGGVRDTLGPLFDRYQVDLVVSGHNHVYERTDPIRGGIRAAEAPTGASIASGEVGTTYICAGGGGMGLTDFAVADRNRSVRDTAPAEFESRLVGPDGSRTRETVDWSRVRYTGHSFVVVDVDPGPTGWAASMRVRMVTIDGAVFDEVTLTRSAPTWLRQHRGDVLAATGGLVAAGLAGAALLAGRDPAPAPVAVPEREPVLPPDDARAEADRRRSRVLAQASAAALDGLDDGAPVDPLLADALGPAVPLAVRDPGGVTGQLALALPFDATADEDPDAADAVDDPFGTDATGGTTIRIDPADDVECFESDDARYVDDAWLPWPFVPAPAAPAAFPDGARAQDGTGADRQARPNDAPDDAPDDAPEDTVQEVRPPTDPADPPGLPAPRRPSDPDPASASGPPRGAAGSPPRP